jgi:hypothetical protein
MSAGFYKYEPPFLHYGTWVLDANYHLQKEHKDDYTYPTDGWYWFDLRKEALDFFNIIEEETEEEVA